MAKKSRKKKKSSSMPFVATSWDMLNSQAYCALSPIGAKLLPFFLGKNHLFYSDENYYRKPFTLPYGEMNRFTGSGDKTIRAAIKSLCDCGFIEIHSPGGLRGAGGKRSEYLLSPKWRDYSPKRRAQ